MMTQHPALIPPPPLTDPDPDRVDRLKRFNSDSDEISLLCKGGCQAEVKTHKGLGGWCVTCRPAEVRRRRHAQEENRKFVADLSTRSAANEHWLPKVKREIEEALAKVERIEGDLTQAKDELHEILKSAQGAIQ